MKNFDPDSFEAQVTGSLSRIEETLKALPDHEKRLRWLERMAYGLVGIWTFLAGWLGIHTRGGH